MLAEARVEQVAELLSEGRLSQRAIARLTGISRGTVGAIASGTRPRHLRPKFADDDLFRPLGPAVRCGGCGGKVQMPCLLCRVRALWAIERRLAAISSAG
jgi:Winged helix-turn-helix DNA-binding